MHGCDNMRGSGKSASYALVYSPPVLAATNPARRGRAGMAADRLPQEDAKDALSFACASKVASVAAWRLYLSSRNEFAGKKSSVKTGALKDNSSRMSEVPSMRSNASSGSVSDVRASLEATQTMFWAVLRSWG